jgi:hemolysin III
MIHEVASPFDEHRNQSLGEEIANNISYGVGLLGALAVAPILIVAASKTESALTVVSVSIFAATVVLLYTSSMIYHSLPRGTAKLVFRTFDHGQIWFRR